MPTYSFKCKHCEKEVEEVRSIKEYDFPGPLCCNTPTDRVFAGGGSGTVFKGRNWPTKEIRIEEKFYAGRRR